MTIPHQTDEQLRIVLASSRILTQKRQSLMAAEMQVETLRHEIESEKFKLDIAANNAKRYAIYGDQTYIDGALFVVTIDGVFVTEMKKAGGDS